MNKKKSEELRRRRLANMEVDRFMAPIEEESRRILDLTEEMQGKMKDYYPRLLEEDLTEEVGTNVELLRSAGSNLSKALQTSRTMQDELGSRMLDINNGRKKRLIDVPPNTAIDQEEETGGHFAVGLNLYKLLIICFTGSFLGVVIEMLWCLVTNGYIESRAGLVYGPFNLLYGVGAVVLTVTLYKFRNRGAWLSFLGGTIVGSVVEYICSWGQELVFGSRSWDYSHMPFNLNGRICLVYSLFWGILGVLWIKVFYPLMAKWILKIPNKAGKIATWVLLVFFVINAAMSGLSMMRWSQRVEGVPASNILWETMDERFPDERMERIYANMVFGE